MPRPRRAAQIGLEATPESGFDYRTPRPSFHAPSTRLSGDATVSDTFRRALRSPSPPRPGHVLSSSKLRAMPNAGARVALIGRRIRRRRAHPVSP